MSPPPILDGMVAAVGTVPLLPDEAETARVVATPLQRLGQSLFFEPFGGALVVVVTLLQVPDGRPAVVRHVCLVLRVQRL